MQDYTPEQIEDIKTRELKAIDMLKELQLSPSAIIEKINTGNDFFVDKVTPFLRDIKYQPQAAALSPIQKDDLPPEQTSA